MSRHKSTRAEQFSAKVHGLMEIFRRLHHRTLPLPTGNDVANYLKWFQQTLQSLVKETRPSVLEGKGVFNHHSYPNMDYTGLFQAVLKITEVVPVVEVGMQAFAESVLSILVSLIPFLCKDELDSLPMMLAMLLTMWPAQIHHYIINIFCGYILPIFLAVLDPGNLSSYVSLSCPALIMTILQYCGDRKQQAQFIETLMRYKSDVCLDILAVLAYGPPTVLNSAGQILLHYFPLKNVGGTDDWQFLYEPWHPVKCQNPECMVPSNNHPIKICLDSTYASVTCSAAPPVFICKKCAEQAGPEVQQDGFLLDIIQPMGKMRRTCETKLCKGNGTPCSYMCFSYDCVKENRLRALTLCYGCHERIHGSGKAVDHITQNLFPDPWSLQGPNQAYPTEAVIRLLGEARPCHKIRNDTIGFDDDVFQTDEECEEKDDNEMDDRRLLSRFGVSLLIGLCNEPMNCESTERLGRLVSMVMTWVECTASFDRDHFGELLKRLASQYACRWLLTVRENRFDLFCGCLSPNPPEYVKVGGCWNTLGSTVGQHIEGLHRLSLLIPHQLITDEVWETVMPLWMEAIKADVPVEELGRLKMLLTQMFDPFLSPYKLPVERQLSFVKKSLDSVVFTNQVQALTWLQILSQLDVLIKLDMLLEMFLKTVQNYSNCADAVDIVTTMFPFPLFSSSEPISPAQDTPTSPNLNQLDSVLSCFIMQLDLLVKQINVLYERQRTFPATAEREDIRRLLKLMLDVSWGERHEDHSRGRCEKCDLTSIWFKLAHLLVDVVYPNGGPFHDEETLNAIAYGHVCRSNTVTSIKSSASHQVETIDEEVFEETAEELKSATEHPHENSQRTVEVSTNETEVLSSEATSSTGMRTTGSSTGSWRNGTSSSPQLQLMMGFLKELPRQDVIAQLSIIRSLKTLLLRGDYLRMAMDTDKECLAEFQDIFISNMWTLVQAEHSQLSQLCVQLLLHCICLPFGAEKLCEQTEGAFCDDDWRVRFSAVEKVAVISRFVEKENVKSNNIAMSALAQCITYLVGAVEDICTAVTTRAVAMLGTIRASSLKLLYKCIEHQYDEVPRDRLLLIHTCRILHRMLPQSTPLCGQFFIRRFKHLLIENADFVSFAGPKTFSSSGIVGPQANLSYVSESSIESGVEGPKRSAVQLVRTQSTSRCFHSRGSRFAASSGLPLTRSGAVFRCTYTFAFPREKVTYNREVSAQGSGKSASGSRQRRVANGLTNQNPAADIAERMFLGGQLQYNLPTLEEEDIDKENSRMSLASMDSIASQGGGVHTEGGSMEAEATHQLVTLAMDFLAYPGDSNGSGPQSSVKTPSYEVIQMSHYLGVLMGYDIKVGEFTGNPLRLRSFPVFHAYMAGIVQVLDENQLWGAELLNLTLQLLLFCAAPRPQRRTEVPEFSLIRLPPHIRHKWLMACLIILYKYPFYHDSHKRDTRNLISVVIYTVQSHDHECKDTKDAALLTQPSVTSLVDNLAGTQPKKESLSSQRTRSSCDRQLSSPVGLASGRGQTCAERKTWSPPAFHQNKVPRQEGGRETENAETGATTHTTSPEKLISSSTPLLAEHVGACNLVMGPQEHGSAVDWHCSTEGADGKAARSSKVSVDSTTSRGRSDSVDGANEEPGRESRSKLQSGVSPSTRSINRPQESTCEKPEQNLGTCTECGVSLEQFDEETLNLCIVVLSTFVHQSPSMAMPLLLRMLEAVGRKCAKPIFPWQDRGYVLVPGSTMEVSKQFIRCVLIRLAPNGIFSEIFRSPLKDKVLLKAIAYSLNEFSAFDQMSPIAFLLEDVIGSRTMNDRLLVLLSNLDVYFEFASREPTSAWQSQLAHFETFFRKLPSVLPENCDLSPVLRIMTAILNAGGQSFMVLLPSFSHVLSFAVNKCSFQLQSLLDLCIKCTESFTKVRDRLCLTRAVVLELVQAIKFRSSIPDANLQALIQFVAIDAGSKIAFGGDSDKNCFDLSFGVRTSAMQCVRVYMTEAVEFIKDWRFTARSNNENRRLSEPNLNVDTLPIQLKASIAQLVALELTQHPKESKIYNKVLGWLKHPPSATQLGTQELLECVNNIRLLSWLLHGSLAHLLNCSNSHVTCHPVSFEMNIHIADFVLIILFSFAEPLKERLNMTALYHAFNLCELWTLYCDQNKNQGESSTHATSIIMEFWGKVTPGILHLLVQAEDLTQTVSHNFLNLLEALHECNSTPLPKLYPMWYPILTYCFSSGVSEANHARLRKSQSRRRINKDATAALSKWLKQLQFKMALAEQSARNACFFVL